MQPHHGRNEKMLRAHSHGVTAVALFVGPDTVSASTGCRSFCPPLFESETGPLSPPTEAPNFGLCSMVEKPAQPGRHSFATCIAPQGSNISATAMQ